MNNDRYERLKRVFHEAVEAEPGRRAALIHDLCEGDSELASEAFLLLGQLESADGFLDAPAHTPPPSSSAAAIASSNGSNGAHDTGAPRFASYTVLRTLGRGGMGVVYLAEQDGTRRTVALKVIRPGLATPGALQRFAFEAQVLGRLNHPGIAQVYDAGTADTGHGPQPYFAMELVDGVSITQHARERNLDARARLALLAQVCDAVEYAHVKGVIHRDLKPANILVMPADTAAERSTQHPAHSTGLVKVLDFGVARATTPALDSSLAGLPSLNTQTGQLVGTLPYMSPEQIAGDPDDVDTRSDVYALGVIGYELLAGRPAFQVENIPPLEGARIVRETEPPPLSSVSRLYKGDIETVIAAAMEKDRERRYRSAGALAADIRRYLNDEPVEARPASAWYQVRKFARRNRVLSTTLVTGFASVSMGAAVAVGFAIRESHARADAVALRELEAESRLEAEQQVARADRHARIARASADVLFDVLAGPGPERAGTLTVREWLDACAGRVTAEPPKPGEVAAAAFDALGGAYLSMGDHERAAEFMERAHRVLRECHGDDHPDTALLLVKLGTIDAVSGNLEAALDRHRRAYESLVRLVGEDDADTLFAAKSLADTYHALRRHEEAEAIIRRVLDGYERTRADDEEAVLSARASLGNVLIALNRSDEAMAVIRDVKLRTARHFGPGAEPAFTAQANYGVALRHAGRPAEAVGELREAAGHASAALDPADPRLVNIRASYARALRDTGRFEDALNALAPTLEAQLVPGAPRASNTPEAAALAVAICDKWGHPERALRFHPLLDRAGTSHWPRTSESQR